MDKRIHIIRVQHMQHLEKQVRSERERDVILRLLPDILQKEKSMRGILTERSEESRPEESG